MSPKNSPTAAILCCMFDGERRSLVLRFFFSDNLTEIWKFIFRTCETLSASFSFIFPLCHCGKRCFPKNTRRQSAPQRKSSLNPFRSSISSCGTTRDLPYLFPFLFNRLDAEKRQWGLSWWLVLHQHPVRQDLHDTLPSILYVCVFWETGGQFVTPKPGTHGGFRYLIKQFFV